MHAHVHVGRRRVDELHREVVEAHVVRERVAKEGDIERMVARVERHASLDHHVAGKFFAQSFVGDAVHGCLIDGRMFVDRGFDFCAVNVLAAAQDHVFRSVADIHEAFVVEMADVAGAEPAVDDGLGGCFGTVPVATDQ